METETSGPKKQSIFDTISAWIIIALIFLLPTLFIPSPFAQFQFSKIILVYVAVMLSLVLWIIARLKDGKIYIARPDVSISLGIIFVVYLAAALFSPVRSISLIGQGFEIATFSFVTAMLVLVFLISNIFIDRKMTVYAYGAFLISALLVGLFQLVRLCVGPSFLGFGVLVSATDNLIGSWSDLGVYFGSLALFSFMTLELLELPKWIKTIGIIILAVSLFFLSVIGYGAVWYVLAVFALIFFVYNFSFSRSKKNKAISTISLVVLIISFLFILIKGNVYSAISTNFGLSVFDRFSVSNLEVQPSWSSTFSIAKNTILHKPVLGVGPNRFVNAWLQFKPEPVNSSIFWSTDFNYGIGLIPTFVTTTGVLGSVAWLLFVLLFLYIGFRSLFKRQGDVFADYLLISSFLMALYFWIFAVVHVPSAVLIVALIVFTGIFFASSLRVFQILPSRTFNIIKDPRTSFISALLLIVGLLGVLFFGYSIGKRYVSSIYFNRALSFSTQGDTARAEASLTKALSLFQSDVYYRALAELNIKKISALFAEKNLSQDVLKNRFQTSFAGGQSAAGHAVGVDGTNYENWISLGHIYEAVVPTNPPAYEQAVLAYAEARRLNPLNPAIALLSARLEVAHNDLKQAKISALLALKLKSNYTDAIYFLAQIQVAEGDLKSAIESVENATTISPNDPGVYFQLGVLRYSDKDYTGAVSALEQALRLAPTYANAQYFLGLSYAKLGKRTEALVQFENLKEKNPENADIVRIIKNITAGRDALTDTTPPVAKPSEGSKLPVQESDSEETPPETANR